MKTFFIWIFELITAPVYRRLARDLTVQLQDISRSYIDYQERIATKFIDELIWINIRLDKLEAAIKAGNLPLEELPEQNGNGSQPGEYSEQDIYEVMKDIQTSLDVVEVCQKRKVPIATFIAWQSKFNGMSASAMQKMRMLEDTNFELQRLLAELSRDNKRLKESTKTPVQPR